jgi:hypothetical protein
MVRGILPRKMGILSPIFSQFDKARTAAFATPWLHFRGSTATLVSGQGRNSFASSNVNSLSS